MTFHERKLNRIIKMLQDCLPKTEEEQRLHMHNSYRFELQEAKAVCIWKVGSDAINKFITNKVDENAN
tara:strand:+ start:444 stop:647 length:204 start_codon:yes stop_codon:yes gene_type:complete